MSALPKKTLLRAASASALVLSAAAVVTTVSLLRSEGSEMRRETRPTSCEEPYRADIRIRVGSQVIAAEVADSDSERQLGLGGRACIGENQGMLFRYDEPGVHTFWMKGMRFAIDMIWLSRDGRVVMIEPDIPASSPNTFTNAKPAMYVLELKAGRAEAIGLANGSRLLFPEQ